MSVYCRLPSEFNREGVALYHSGDLFKASQCFQYALEALDCKYSCDKRKVASSHKSVVDDVALHCYGECGHFIYSAPFVTRRIQRKAYVSTVELHAQRAAILFNLGLSFHQQSLQTSTNKVHLLRAAMGYYNTCLKLLKVDKLLKTCANLCIAVLNNKASLYFEVMAFDEGYKTFQFLASIMRDSMYYQSVTLPQEVLTSIVLNIANSGPPKLAHAA